MCYILINNRYIGDLAYGEKADPISRGPAPRCKACGVATGMLEWLPPFRITLGKGVKSIKPGDIVFGSYEGIIVSEKFKSAWENYSLEGIIEWRPVEIVGPRAFSGDLFYPRLKPATARVDFKKTDYLKVIGKPKPMCQECLGSGYDAIRDVHLEADSIPSDDLFEVKGILNIFASKRFKEMAEAEGLANVELVKPEDYVWDTLHLFDKEG